MQSLKSPSQENMNIQVISWHVKSKGKYKCSYLARLHSRERPNPEEEGEMKSGEAGFQSTRDQRMKKRIQLRNTLLGLFKQKERQIST